MVVLCNGYKRSIDKKQKPRSYWTIKRRKNELSTICRQLKLTAKDSKKYLTDVVDDDGVNTYLKTYNLLKRCLKIRWRVKKYVEMNVAHPFKEGNRSVSVTVCIVDFAKRVEKIEMTLPPLQGNNVLRRATSSKSSFGLCDTSNGETTISPNGRRTVTVDLPLETSIPTAFISDLSDLD